MGYVELVRSHVERCLEDVWEQGPVRADGDGDYCFRRGVAAGYVRIDATDPVLVGVFAIAAHGVRRSAKLLAELDSVNARARTVAVFWADGTVVARQVLLAGSVDRESLGQACTAVGVVADDIGALIAGVYGGRTPFPALDEPMAEQTG